MNTITCLHRYGPRLSLRLMVGYPGSWLSCPFREVQVLEDRWVFHRFECFRSYELYLIECQQSQHQGNITMFLESAMDTSLGCTDFSERCKMFAFLSTIVDIYPSRRTMSHRRTPSLLRRPSIAPKLKISRNVCQRCVRVKSFELPSCQVARVNFFISSTLWSLRLLRSPSNTAHQKNKRRRLKDLSKLKRHAANWTKCTGVMSSKGAAEKQAGLTFSLRASSHRKLVFGWT